MLSSSYSVKTSSYFVDLLLRITSSQTHTQHDQTSARQRLRKRTMDGCFWRWNRNHIGGSRELAHSSTHQHTRNIHRSRQRAKHGGVAPTPTAFLETFFVEGAWLFSRRCLLKFSSEPAGGFLLHFLCFFLTQTLRNKRGRPQKIGPLPSVERLCRYDEPSSLPVPPA